MSASDNCETRFGRDPRSTYAPGSERLVTLAGTTVDVGYERVTWFFRWLTVEAWEDWLTLVGGYSGQVYVETRDDVDDWAEYSAIARLPRPSTLRRRGGKYLDVTVELILLEVIT